MKNDTSVLQPGNSLYPESLIDSLRGIALTCIGNLDLLAMRAIGICGSRNASDDALKYVYKFGVEAGKRELVVVSGNARGIDRQAHRGVLESGGCTIAVLPEGMGYFRINRELKPHVRMDENFLAISMFPDNAKWQAWRAMERNKLIVGLSSGMFVIEAKETGGTINAAMECVRQGKRLWAVAYSQDTPGRAGNRLLLQDQAIPVSRIKDVKQALDMASGDVEQYPKQFAMELA